MLRQWSLASLGVVWFYATICLATTSGDATKMKAGSCLVDEKAEKFKKKEST